MDELGGLRLDHPELRALLELWQTKAAGREMPARRDFDVLELRPWLGYLVLVDVVDDGADFFYRVHGTNLVQLIGFDMTGKLLSSTTHEVGPRVMSEYRATMAARRPLTFDMRVVRSAVSPGPWVKLILPLSRDGQRVDQLLMFAKPIFHEEGPQGR